MPDPAAFLAAITASPDDDLPRLVYADWLDETCQQGAAARAEFIRVQCELERLPPGDDRRLQLRLREAALWKRHRREWTAEAVEAIQPVEAVKPKWEFRRGFLHGLTLQARRFPQVADALFRAAPTVRAARLAQGSGHVAGLLRTPQLERLSDLGLSRMCTCGRCPILNELQTLFASPRVANLTRLAVGEDRIDAATVAALVSSTHLTRLRGLDLSQNALGLPGVRVLAAARGFAALRELNLSDNGITPYGGRAIAGAGWLPGIRVLDLSRNRLGDVGGRAVLNAEFGDRLERLELRTNEIGPEVRRLLRARFGARVRV